jgi:hypothetical protein
MDGLGHGLACDLSRLAVEAVDYLVRTCIYVYMHKYLYMYKDVCSTSKYVHIYTYQCISVYIEIDVCRHVFIYGLACDLSRLAVEAVDYLVSMYIYTCMYIYIYINICIYI